MKKFNLIWIGVIAAVVLSACGGAAPAAAPAANTMPSTINVTGNGQVSIVPDVAYINIGVHSEAPEVTTALDQNNQQAQAIAATLQQMGVADEDIQTTAFNVYPMQEYSPMGEVTGTKYSVDNTVYVAVRDLSNLGQLLDGVVQAGANTINSITFDATDKDAAYTQARQLAVENARKQAEELAAAAGVEVGEVTAISAYSSGPVTAYDAKVYNGQGGNGVPTAAGEIVINVDASITFAIR